MAVVWDRWLLRVGAIFLQSSVATCDASVVELNWPYGTWVFALRFAVVYTGR